MASFTQENRLLTINTPLGPDVFLLLSFTGTEAISRPFHFHLELLSADFNIQAKDIVGKNVTWVVNHVDKEPRYFNGIVSRFGAGDRQVYEMRSYYIEVVPWLWFLSQTTNCRVFHEPPRNVPKIIKTIFDEHGFTDYEPLPHPESYPDRDFVVQYRETACNFVSRLMEDAGMFYFFKHENGKHTLVMGDANTAFYDCAEREVMFSSGSMAQNHITSWKHQFEFRSGKVSYRDYNFETPRTDLLASADTLIDQPGASSFELYDYPGVYLTTDDGAGRSKLRMEEVEVAYQTVNGASGCPTFTPGGKFTLTEHPLDSEAGKGYVVTSIKHKATDVNFAANTGQAEYSNTFTCIPDSVTFRPARITPKPALGGPQTAVVVGPAGEEIYTDKYSRIKVQFHWDREGKFDDKSSCWVRVASVWAGKGYGIINIPRIGQEVVIDFLEGDPDQPLVIGSVYNADQMPPTNLPQERMIGGLRSRTYPGGNGYNGMLCDDTKSKEKVTIHAQHDMITTVEHDDTQTVHNDRTITVDGKHTETIKGDTSITISKGNYSFDVQTGTSKTHVASDVTETYDAKQTTQVTGPQTTTVKNAITITSTDSSIDLGAATSIQLHVGDTMIWLDKGQIHLKSKLIIIEGTDEVSINPAKVTIEATDMKTHASGTIKTVADGVHTIKGSEVDLNC